MNEQEIDALMVGQEDESGSVHYEGTRLLSFRVFFFYLFFFVFYEMNLFEPLFPPAFVKHILSV